jgi:Gluconate 2-dehydrogenase subunit 3
MTRPCTRGGGRVLHRPGPRHVSLAARERLSGAARRVSGGISRTASGAASFASLKPEEQVHYLRTVDHTPFFDTTRLLTLLGMFSLPAYGGNRNGVGWKLIGFEDRHFFRPPFGFYDRGYPGFVIDREKMP